MSAKGLDCVLTFVEHKSLDCVLPVDSAKGLDCVSAIVSAKGLDCKTSGLATSLRIPFSKTLWSSFDTPR